MSSPEPSSEDIPLAKNLRARVLYEATLQDLLQARNYVVTQLLRERNGLLDERRKLTGEEIDYSPMDFLHPPPPLLPYITTSAGAVLQRRIRNPVTAWFPKDRRRFEVGTQTIEHDAADVTLVDIGPDIETQNSKSETSNKRRRIASCTEQNLVEYGSGCKSAEGIRISKSDSERKVESVVASIHRASSESAAQHADDIRDIVHDEREEMARQLQLECEEARAAREALEQQVLAERAHAEEERNACVRELEGELAHVCAELDHEKQRRDHDEEQPREANAQRDNERDEMRQQLSEITDLLLAHREEFARKKETRWEDLYRMVQGIIEDRTGERERCEEERRAAADKPSTQDITDTMRSENLTLRELFDRLTDSWREETERQHKESKQSGKDVSGFGEARSNFAATKARRTVSKM
ncbi:hypothetical protein H4582DRAFT_2202957 [Lactarius indigo]|nr:hypothetical protein H4582DRAFT_2202957 [Lactarius indigo]